MALAKNIYNLLEKYFKDPQLRYAELGAQYVCGEEWGGYGPPYFVDIFDWLDVTSYDVTHEHRSEFLNLSNELPPKLYNKFDVVTNFGTTEHVQEQYTCWKNIFHMLKKGGTVLSVTPKKHNWPGHCKYYYDESTYFSMYKDFVILELHSPIVPGQGAEQCAVIMKRHDGEFLTTQEELMSSILVIDNYRDRQGF